MSTRRLAPWFTGLLAVLVLLVGLGADLFAQAQNLPPKPDRYVTDQAGVLDGSTLSRLNDQLESFEKATSNQIVVAIYSNLPPDAEIAQYATMTYNAWQLGLKGKDNGALLMIFVDDRKMFICTGRGLEGALPDAICKDIVTQVIRPRFKQGDYAGGIQAGVNAIIGAMKGEYKGTGTTVAEGNGADQGIPWGIIILFIIIFVVSRYGAAYGGFGPVIYSSGGWGGGGGGGYSGGGGGGFSGGGGSSAGGGAGGGW